MSSHNKKSRIVRKVILDQIATAKAEYDDGGLAIATIYDPDGKKITVDVSQRFLGAPEDYLPLNCLGATLSRQEVFDAISLERDYQDDKWGVNRAHSLADFMLIMKHELDEAIEGWMKDRSGRNSPLNEICQVAAVAVAAMERYGATGITLSTDDIPV